MKLNLNLYNKLSRKALNRCKTSLWMLLLLCFLPSVNSARENVFNFHHYTNEDGLPSSYVKSVVQDKLGFMWMATRVSVVRFDGSRFIEFPAYNEFGEETDLFCNKVFMYNDSLLVARTNRGRYYYFDQDNETFHAYMKLNNLGQTQSLMPAADGYWLCRNDELLFFDSATGRLTGINEKLEFSNLPDKHKFLQHYNNKNKIVALTDTGILLWIDIENSEVKSFNVREQVNPMLVRLYYIDYNSNIWFGEESNGLLRLNTQTGNITRYSKDKAGNKRLPHNMVHCFTEDADNRIWIGTEAGLSIVDDNENSIHYCRYDPANPNGLNTDPIYDAFCDKDGNVWLGTYFGGLNFWNGKESFFHTWQSGVGKWSLGGNVVSCLNEDQDGNIWVGLEDMGLNMINIENGQVNRYISQNSGLSYNNIHDLHFVDDKTLWIATYTGGINILDIKSKTFTYLNVKNAPNLHSDNIYAFMQVGDSLFVSTSAGVNLYHLRDKTFQSFFPEILNDYQFESMARNGNTLWFSSALSVYYYDIGSGKLHEFDKAPEMANINFVRTDSKQRIWIGDCYDGLCCYNPADESVKFFNPQTGFPGSWMFSLQEADNGWFWVSCNSGLIKFHPENDIYTLFDTNSGIPFNQFNYRASYTDSRGITYFGGNNGMVSFNMNDSLNVDNHKDIRFTGFQLFNKYVQPGVKGSPLDKSLNRSDRITLNHNQNIFTLEFTSFSYASLGRSQYAYYLEGFEDDWNHVGNRNYATYTNLSPGKYTFHVKGYQNEMDTNNEGRTLQIVVKPPIWLSHWAFLVYFILAWGFSIVIYMVGRKLEKSKALVEIERRDKEHSEEINKVKLEFFTNISHELKTPLTLIMGPLKKVLGEEKLSPISRKRLTGIERNSHRLFNLINQLLEFRKVETGREVLKIEKIEIAEYIAEIVRSFESLVESTDIQFAVSTPKPGTEVWIDPGKVERIIFNLLINAFKYTSVSGVVNLKVSLGGKDVKKNGSKELLISVSDSGKGIAPEMIDKVFDRFFHSGDGNMQIKSSGIGLAYVKSLVQLHKGKISVESNPDGLSGSKGTIFSVRLPASEDAYTVDEIVHDALQYVHELPSMVEICDEDCRQLSRTTNANYTYKTIMLVEDNHELVDFMRETLEENYKVYVAYDGTEALEQVRNIKPDLIVSDVMMPRMDGLELTQILKNDIQTSHIPVILLTAKSGAENRLTGLGSGADFYIEKPFYPQELEQNICNILNTRKALIDKFMNDAFVPVSDIAQSESDKLFIEKITEIIKKNLNNTSFDVSELVKEMGLSRSLLHMKLKSIANCSTTEYIRTIKLKEAVKLISSGKCNISEAAYEAGFSSPTYFTRRFKEHYGKSPREYF
ncbi:MAG: response regulator, partial [Prolixibacteraceae bacterium]|nr:response regulator [Prolixibacteraceae bacterium]